MGGQMPNRLVTEAQREERHAQAMREWDSLRGMVAALDADARHLSVVSDTAQGREYWKARHAALAEVESMMMRGAVRIENAPAARQARDGARRSVVYRAG